MNSTANPKLDVLVVGAGFSGLYLLYHFRKLGYNVKIFEAANQIGGTWHWNRYPGARVDSPVPLYGFSMEEVWRDWNWTERFPGREELRAYFAHADRALDFSKDIYFNTRITTAQWDKAQSIWIIHTEDGKVASARFLVLAVGFTAKVYTPIFPGVETFQGDFYHTARWPGEGVDFKGKRVAVIGIGASGIQVIQELGKAGEVGQLTVFQRTPAIAIPMRQCKLDASSQDAKHLYPIIYRRRLQTTGGFTSDGNPKPFVSMTPEERALCLEEAYANGTFDFLGLCSDLYFDETVNTEVYTFWKEKTRARIHDPRMQEKLAPDAPPHPIGARRHSLEQTYYEVFNQPNVDLVDLNETSITQFGPGGILTADGVQRDFDVVILATGFDAITGGIAQLDIRGVDGTSIGDKWKDGVYTNLGMTAANFPNMFFMCGPQGATVMSNWPSCMVSFDDFTIHTLLKGLGIQEIQGNWIIDCIKYMMDNSFTSIEPTREAEIAWRSLVIEMWDLNLVRKGKSWWNGANVPGKVVEPLSLNMGIKDYGQLCREKANSNYEGFCIL
ncbi:hypothetical protein VNI00_003548 [Paramarasmius palmivorus]|uniref:FAD/NAD(P)-binding domain-containing protein n=1 Tax=Paramarasmius palmivorus TaxID=297713 RepID=A0AAW0DRQ4_9AGAR